MDRDTRKRTGQDGLAAWATVAAAAAAVVVVAGGAWAVTRGGGDSTSAGADPSTSPTTSNSSTPTSPTTSASSPTDSPSSGGSASIAWPAACTKAAKQAMSAGLAVVGPAALPQGWTVLGCAYTPGPASWSVDVSSPKGPIRLVQSSGSEDTLVKAYLGSAFSAGSPVTADGTGRWHSWSGPARANALSKAFPGSAVVLKGNQSAAYLTGYAGAVLTYETAPGGPGDDVGGG